MPPDQGPFDLQQLSERIVQAREDRNVTWSAISKEVGVATSTIRRFATASDAEADGVLALIGWLGVAPEQFVANTKVPGMPLPPVRDGCIRVDMTLVSASPGWSGSAAISRTTIQRLAMAADASGTSISSLTRWSPI